MPCRSALARDALALVAFKAKSGRSPSATEPLFSCVAKRKVTKREGHPAWRLPPIHGRQVREPGPGFSPAHPCAGEKASASKSYEPTSHLQSLMRFSSAVFCSKKQK